MNKFFNFQGHFLMLRNKQQQKVNSVTSYQMKKKPTLLSKNKPEQKTWAAKLSQGKRNDKKQNEQFTIQIF